MTGFLLLWAAVALPASLAGWKAEIEKAGMAVVLLRLPAGPGTTALAVPAGTPQAEVLRQYTDQPGFVAQYRGAQAMTVSYAGAEGRTSFVLVNPPLAGEGEEEEAVIAHEFGHIWLKAQRYPAPVYVGGEAACLSVHAGDAVQHVLIRAEMTRRGVRWRRPWLVGLETALRQMQSEPGAARGVGRCQTLAQAAMWVDAALGGGDWSRKSEFLAAMARRFPVVAPAAGEISAYLAGRDLTAPETHAEALRFVFNRMKQLALAVPAAGTR